MDPITRLLEAAAKGDTDALAELAAIARCAPETKRRARTPGVEYTVLPARLETKAEGRRVIGYGATFEPADRHDSHGDIIRPGAFAGSIAMHKAEGTAPLMHDSHLEVIGQWDVFEEDIDGVHGKPGLYVEGDVIDTTSGEDTLKLIRAGVYKGLSIGFITVADRYMDGYGGRPLVLTKWGYPVREILELKLIEVSILGAQSNIYAEILEVRAARLEQKRAIYRPQFTDIDALCARMAAATINANAALAAANTR